MDLVQRSSREEFQRIFTGAASVSTHFSVRTESSGEGTETKRGGRRLRMSGLCSLPVIAGEDAAEFAFTPNLSLGHWHELFIKNVVADIFPLMRTFRVIMADPCFDNVVQLLAAEADEVIQALMFCLADPALDERIRAGRFGRDFYWPHVRFFPKRVKLIGKYSVPVSALLH